MPRHRSHRRSTMPLRQTRVQSYAMGSDSPQSNKDSDSMMPVMKNWGRRRPRRLPTPRYVSSHSEEDDDDDRIFTPLKRSARIAVSPKKITRTRQRPSTCRRYGQTEEINSTPDNTYMEPGSIRRSTRQRKLKYDNYNDSWIVGSQTVKGYPCYMSNSHGRSERLQRRPGRQLAQVDEAEEEDEGEEEEEDEEEEEEEEEGSGVAPAPRRGRGTGRRMSHIEDRRMSGGKNLRGEIRTSSGRLVKRTEAAQMAIKEEQQSQESQPEPSKAPEVQENGEDGQSESSSVSSEEAKPSDPPQDQNFQDMYARVKQRRRAAASRPLENNEQNRNRQNKSESDISSDSSEGEIVDRRSTRRIPSRRTYHLRQVKPTVKRFQAEPSEPMRVLGSLRRRRPPPRRRRWSSSSSSSDSSRDQRYDRKKPKGKSSKSMALCGGNNKAETTGLLADVDPVALDTSIRFSNVGGLESHINCLKEMVVFPMLYKEIFEKFNVTPPKGVLFHGPPGTGKTLMARALANECSQGSRKVSFFMRKGADCLSKWVGESERQLRLLFEEAKQARPSIIFFDELDGLAPVRSSKQDQIHASIVCTLLALMDGLDNRGDIIVIGATNRIDSIDPALRRPGRFDRELYFPLPGVKERKEILSIHCQGWGDESVLSKMAEESWGYCGSDLKALCSEAVIQSLKRVYPQIYSSSQKLRIDSNKVKVEKSDFMKAKRGIVPASKRGVSCVSRRLPSYLEPLLSEQLESLYKYISRVFPHNGSSQRERVTRSPRLVIVGEKKSVIPLSCALLHKLEHCSVLSISLESIYSDASISPEESISRVFRELPQRPGSVLWLGDVLLWWNSLSELTRSVFTTLIDCLDPTLPVLFLAVSVSSAIPAPIKRLFSEFHGEQKKVPPPTAKQKQDFFAPLFKVKALKPPLIKKKPEELEPLDIAPPTPPLPLTEAEMNRLYYEEETTLRELRIFLRQICAKLARNKQFYMFSKPVDINEVPDYLNIIHEPMDLETMMTKIDLHKYTCAQDFLKDVDLLCRNALEYNPDKDPEDKLIRHRACYLRDTAYALIKAEMDSDFEVTCQKIRDKRTSRGAEPASTKFVRDFFPDHPIERETEEQKPMDVVMNGEGDSRSVKTGTPVDSDPEVANKPRKRKRRTSLWAKGMLTKKRSSGGQQQGTEDSPNRDGCESPNEESSSLAHSTPLKKPHLQHSAKSNSKSCEDTDMVNGMLFDSGDSKDLLDESLALTELSAVGDNAAGDNEKQLLVDFDGLNKLHTSVLSHAAEMTTYSSLIDLYVSLAQVIESYSRKWDRKNLVQELNSVLNSFIENYSDDEDTTSPIDTEVP